MTDLYIKPCPHCGGPACLNSSYSYKTRNYFAFVRCEVCGAQGKTYRSEKAPAEEDWNNYACKSAIEAWNLRYKEDFQKEPPDEKGGQVDNDGSSDPGKTPV